MLDGGGVLLRGTKTSLIEPSGRPRWTTDLRQKLTACKGWIGGVYVLSETDLFALNELGKLLWKRHLPGVFIEYVSRNGVLVLNERREVKPDFSLWSLLMGHQPRNPQSDETTTLHVFRPNGQVLWKWKSDGQIDAVVAQTDAQGGAGEFADRIYAVGKSGVYALDPGK